MNTKDVLGVIETLHNAAEHPDIVHVERYGRDTKPGGQSPAGVAVRYQSGSEVYLWAADPGNPLPAPHDLPAEMPPLRFRAQHGLKFLLQLLDTAQPEMFTAWRPVAFDGIDMKPSGVELRGKDGSSFYLRVTSGSGPTGGPESDDNPNRDRFLDYVIPEGVKTCLQEVDAVNAERS